MKRWQIPRTWLILGLAAAWTVGGLLAIPNTAHAERGWGVRDRNGNGIPDYRERSRSSRVRYARDRNRNSSGVRYYRDRNGNLYTRASNRNRYYSGQSGSRSYRNRYGASQSWNGYQSGQSGSRSYRNRYGTTQSWNGRSRRSRDRDRDGILDYRDWDRDGDGIPNSRDRYPNRRSGSSSGRVNTDWDRDGVLNWNDHWPRDRRRR